MMFAKTESPIKKKKQSQLPGISKKDSKPKKKAPYVHQQKYQESLIDIKDLNLPKKLTEQPDFEQLDKLLLSTSKLHGHFENGQGDDSKLSDSSKDGDISTVPNSSSNTYNSSIPAKSLASAIVGQGKEQDKVAATREKYRQNKFPLPCSKQELKRKTEQHLDLVPRLLAGEEELSIYYTFAYHQRQQSPHVTMSTAESFDIKWQKYVAGFYGLARQNYVSSLIQAKYGNLLRKSRNKTVIYWSPDMFSTYVLANEIILRIVMEDMDVSKEEAEILLRESVDYGCDLADDIELADDLAFGESEILTTPGNV